MTERVDKASAILTLMFDCIYEQGQEPMNADNAAALAALRRAAIKARRHTLALNGSVLIRKDGKYVYESDPAVLFPEGMGDEPASEPQQLR